VPPAGSRSAGARCRHEELDAGPVAAGSASSGGGDGDATWRRLNAADSHVLCLAKSLDNHNSFGQHARIPNAEIDQGEIMVKSRMACLSAMAFQLTLFSAGCFDAVEGTDCSEVLSGDVVPPIIRCFEPRTYRCDTDDQVWKWETCCYCREPTDESPGGTYCLGSCIDTGLPE